MAAMAILPNWLYSINQIGECQTLTLTKMKRLRHFISALLVSVLFTSCSTKGSESNASVDSTMQSSKEPLHCDFLKADIKMYRVGTDEILGENEVMGCFTITEGEMGLIEISSEQSNLKIIYYEETDPKALRFLDIIVGDNASRWRANKGHDLFIMDTSEALNLIFGDREESIKGTVKLIKS